MLLQQLPADSALVRSMRGPEASWTPGEHLLALACDLLAEANWLYTAAHTEKGKAPPRRPQPVQRPGAADKAVRTAERTDLSGAEIAERLIAQREAVTDGSRTRDRVRVDRRVGEGHRVEHPVGAR